MIGKYLNLEVFQLSQPFLMCSKINKFLCQQDRTEYISNIAPHSLRPIRIGTGEQLTQRSNISPLPVLYDLYDDEQLFFQLDFLLYLFQNSMIFDRKVVLVLFLLQITLNTETTQVQVDFTASIQQLNVPLLEEVQKKVVVDYDFQLAGDNNWHQFPELDLTFDLPYSQSVKIFYHTAIVTTSPTDGLIVSRLIVDGKEKIEFSGIGAYSYYPVVFRYGEINLSKGPHRIFVQYLTRNARIVNRSTSLTNYLIVKFHRLASSG